jgi:hypothetical protein
MKRRTVLYLLSGAGVATLGTAGYSWYWLGRSPDLAFAQGNKALIAALAETIIPRTEGSPGARDAGVEDFVLKMLKDCLPRKEQNRFISGLKDVQAYCQDKYGHGFEECKDHEQEEALAYFEIKGRSYPGIAGKVSHRLLGRSFFKLLKDLAVEGYCTSRRGATEGLAYLYIPGSFHGCVPLEPGQKCWATD